jgi:hypothetical protein
MVICDGFNVPEQNGNTQTPVAPFPRLNNKQNESSTPLSTPTHLTHVPNGTTNKTTLNGHIQNGVNLSYSSIRNTNNNNNINNINNNNVVNKTPKLELNSPLSNCNYDNLRSVDDEDDNDSENNLQNENNAPKLNGNGVSKNHAIKNSTPINNNNLPAQQQTSSLPLTDKNLMNNIMNKTINNNFDIKSQSMFHPNNNNNNTVNNTPISLVKIDFFDSILYFS